MVEEPNRHDTNENPKDDFQQTGTTQSPTPPSQPQNPTSQTGQNSKPTRIAVGIFEALVRFLDRHGPAVTSLVAVVTTLATVAIAVLTCVYVRYSRAQWTVMSGQLAEMQAGQRPYVGILEIELSESNGGTIMLAKLKNFGHIPAFKFSANWTFSMNGIDLPHPDQKGPARTFTFYPGANQGLEAKIAELKWAGIASGRDQLRLRVSTRYRGPSEGQEYTECEEREYSTITKNFVIVGECSESPRPN